MPLNLNVSSKFSDRQVPLISVEGSVPNQQCCLHLFCFWPNIDFGPVTSDLFAFQSLASIFNSLDSTAKVLKMTCCLCDQNPKHVLGV